MDQAAKVDEVAAGKAKMMMTTFVGRNVRVTLADGRVITGRYQCMDGHRNFILQHGSERRTVKERQGEGWVEREAVRSLGLVMVPGKHSVKFELQR